jgi:ribose/xylose/arabinose/galactoside ABC-type transport system permease subunit
VNIKPLTWTTGISGYVLLAGAVVINIAIQGGRFFSAPNLSSLFSSNLPLILAALAQMIVMLSGGIDISLGNIMALVNGIAILTTNTFYVPVAAGWTIALLAGTFAGLVNGLVITYLRIPPLLVTFAMSTLIRGVALIVLPKPGGTVPVGLYRTYAGRILGVPTALWLLVLVLLPLLALVKFRFSRHLVAVGTDERNAYISGINVNRIKTASYVLGGFVASLAGLCLTAFTASGDVRIGESFALQSIAAVIIGGTLAGSGWKNYIAGTVCGAVFLAIVNNIVFFVFNAIARNNPGIQISTFYQQLLSNLIIIFGLASAVLTSSRQKGGGKQQ